MLGVKVLFDSRNMTIIEDINKHHIWLYSYQMPIAFYDGGFCVASEINDKQYRHLMVFKNKIKNKEIC